MDGEEIRELRGFYVKAARRALSAGFDIATIYAAHGHAITQQFLEPYYNRRTDEYGGSLENRARFLRETVEEVRYAIGDRCAVAVRLCLDSLRPRGIDVDDAAAVVELLDELVDLWDFTVGGVVAQWGEDTLSSRFATEHYERPWLEQVKPHTAKPVVGVGRFMDPNTMVEAIPRWPSRHHRLGSRIDRRPVPPGARSRRAGSAMFAVASGATSARPERSRERS